MFELPLWQLSQHARTGSGQWLAEFVATFGLLLTILGCAARTPAAIPLRGRPLHHRGLLVHRLDLLRQPRRDDRALDLRYFYGDRAFGAPAFIVAQFVGMAAALMLSRWLWPDDTKTWAGGAEAQNKVLP